MKYIFFFATSADIAPVLKRFEAHAPLKFVAMGRRETPNRAIYLTASDIPDIGIATHETGSLSQGYMVSCRDTMNHMRAYTDKWGVKHWTLNNCDNEDAVTLVMAGLWKTGTLLPGNMATLHRTPAAQQLMRHFLSALRKEGFTKVRNWWLGPEAMAMLKAGKRLATTAEQSPLEYDLRLPEQEGAGRSSARL